MTPSLISCIVPVFNGEIYLAEALESILNQTYKPLEIIVADDGSTDGTAAVAARHSARVRYVWQPNSGAAARRRAQQIFTFERYVDAYDKLYQKINQQTPRVGFA